MRIDEIASAEDQIALFKLITDKVWQSLAELERADAEAKAQQPLKAKLTAKTNARAYATKRAAPAKIKQAQLPKTSTVKYQQLPQSQTSKQQVQPGQSAKQFNTPNSSFDSKLQKTTGDSGDDKELL